jgi:ankyrin repeat protein
MFFVRGQGGMTALMAAAQKGDKLCVEMLLQAKAETLARDKVLIAVDCEGNNQIFLKSFLLPLLL